MIVKEQHLVVDKRELEILGYIVQGDEKKLVFPGLVPEHHLFPYSQAVLL